MIVFQCGIEKDVGVCVELFVEIRVLEHLLGQQEEMQVVPVGRTLVAAEVFEQKQGLFLRGEKVECEHEQGLFRHRIEGRLVLDIWATLEERRRACSCSGARSASQQGAFWQVGVLNRGGGVGLGTKQGMTRNTEGHRAGDDEMGRVTLKGTR